MAGEIQIQAVSGQTIYAILYSSAGKVHNTVSDVFETWADGSISSYDIALVEQGTSGFYIGNFPLVDEDVYSVVARIRSGGSPAVSDLIAGTGNVSWNGSQVVGSVGDSGEIEINVGHSEKEINVKQGISTSLAGKRITITKGNEVTY